MLRGDNIICGTSSTGTGTLTLAAVPEPPGGLDFDAWLRATGMGFGNSAAVLVPYSITEYADATFAKVVGYEKGVGTVTLGSSAGIANCTLARTLVQYKVTGMDTGSQTITYSPATNYSIVTAANVEVTISPSSADVPAYHPFFDTAGDTNWGVTPDGLGMADQLGDTSMHWPVGDKRDHFQPFRWSVPMLVKRCTIRASATSPTGTGVAYLRLYDARSSDGRPGKLLYDFGATGALTNGTANYSATQGSGFFMTPGDYWLELLLDGTSLTGGTGLTTLGPITVYHGNWLPIPGRLGAASGLPNIYLFRSSLGTAGAAPDPADLTSASLMTAASFTHTSFGLSPT